MLVYFRRALTSPFISSKLIGSLNPLQFQRVMSTAYLIDSCFQDCSNFDFSFCYSEFQGANDLLVSMSVLWSLRIIWVLAIQFLRSHKVEHFPRIAFQTRYSLIIQSSLWIKCYICSVFTQDTFNAFLESVAPGCDLLREASGPVVDNALSNRCISYGSLEKIHTYSLSHTKFRFDSFVISIFPFRTFVFYLIFFCLMVVCFSGEIPAAASFVWFQCWSQSIQRYTPCPTRSDSWIHSHSQRTLIWSQIFQHFEMIRLGKINGILTTKEDSKEWKNWCSRVFDDLLTKWTRFLLTVEASWNIFMDPSRLSECSVTMSNPSRLHGKDGGNVPFSVSGKSLHIFVVNHVNMWCIAYRKFVFRRWLRCLWTAVATVLTWSPIRSIECWWPFKTDHWRVWSIKYEAISSAVCISWVIHDLMTIRCGGYWLEPKY